MTPHQEKWVGGKVEGEAHRPRKSMRDRADAVAWRVPAAEERRPCGTARGVRREGSAVEKGHRHRSGRGWRGGKRLRGSGDARETKKGGGGEEGERDETGTANCPLHQR